MQMLHKRTTAVFCAMVLLLTGMVYRIYFINASDYITTAAQVQGKYELTVATMRGVIYDRDMKRLVSNGYRYVAAVLPTPQAAAALVPAAPEQERSALLERLSDGRPFAISLPDSNVYATGIDLFRVPERYGAMQYAPHLIGYLGDGGVGAAGLERAYDTRLSEAGGKIDVVYRMDAAGRMMEDGAVAVERKQEEAVGGVVLSLDREIQQITQEALAGGCEKGAAVVLDIYTGDILAMASLPVFDQNNIAASLDSDTAPFINRAISGYNIGSVYKLIVSAAALEHGVPQSYQHECKGFIDVQGQIFRCNNNAVHGLCNMQRALEVSCNSYFISLAQQIPRQQLISMSENMGLGRSLELAPGMYTQAGNLPDDAELANPAGYANLSFGQGSSMASPLQMAQAVACIANSGLAVTPRLVRGETLDGVSLHNPTPTYSSNRVLGERNAQVLSGLMVKVVEEGSGKPARPAIGSAGGKTSSAQTGQMNGEKEIVHAWFAGFYPAEKPRYSIVVLVEGGESGERVAAPIFKQIADGAANIGAAQHPLL